MEQTLEEMKASVVENSHGKINQFEITKQGPATVKELLQQGDFGIKVNNKPFQVYPDYTQVLR